MFKQSIAYAERHASEYDKVLILSALHGLIELDDVYEPYDVYLDDLNKRQVSELVNKVRGLFVTGDTVACVCSNGYAELLRAAIYRDKVVVPMLHLCEDMDMFARARHIGSA